MLDGIPPSSKGVPQIEVTFDIDVNGILSVSAKDNGTGKEQKITIKASGGLSESQIAQMVQDAEANKETDEKFKEGMEVRNHADTLIGGMTTSVKEHGDKVTPEEKAKVETDIKNLEEAIKGDDIEDIKNKSKALEESAKKLGDAAYKEYQKEQAAEQAKQKANGSTETKKEETTKNDNVVDADFEDVTEDKKD